MSESNPWVVADPPTENPWVKTDEPAVEEDKAIVVELPTIPEEGLPEPTAIVRFKEKTDLFVPKDEISFKSCAHFVAQCKLAAKNLDKQYHDIVDPLNKKRAEAKREYGDPSEAFLELAKQVTIRMEVYAEEVRQAAELEQKRLNDLAEAKRKKLEEQEAELRKQAEVAREAGDEKTAQKLEQKAETTEIKAAEVVPQTVALPSTKVDVGGATLSIGNGSTPKKIWSLPGWDKDKPMRVLFQGKVDHRIAGILGDVSKLPEGVQFILQHCDLNPVHLNASYKGGTVFPKPFAEVPDLGKSRLR